MALNPESGIQHGELPMIGVTLVDELLQKPPAFFSVDHSYGAPTIQFDHTQINVCVSSTKRLKWFPESMGRVLTVQTIGEYEDLTRQLLEKPLFFDVSLERFTAPAFENYTKTTNAEMFVTVNTSHSVIRGQLLKVIGEGRRHMAAGEKFALEIDFNSCLKDWFRSLFIHEEGLLSCLNTIADCDHGGIVITNCTEFMDCYSCTGLGSAILCLCCLPCCLLSCPCYRIQRFLTTSDHRVSVQGEVMYLSWTPSDPRSQDRSIRGRFLVLQEADAGSRVRGIQQGQAI